MTKGRSIWELETFFAEQDVIIVGSGFVGLWSAYYLKKKAPGLRVSIVEAGLIPTGASTRNAGFACFGSLSELVWDAQTMGTEKMLELVEMRFNGLQRILSSFKKKEIDFSWCGGYELYDPGQLGKKRLIENAAYLNSLVKSITGQKKTYRLVDEKIKSFGFGKTNHLVENQLEGYLHSGKLLQALLHKVQGMGVQVWTSLPVTGFREVNNGIELDTAGGALAAAKVLLCTNAFTKELVPELDITPGRGQVLLTTPLSKLPFEGTFHADEGFYYFRNLGSRVLLGGARHKAINDETTTEMETTTFIQQQLETYLSEVILPQYKGQFQIEHRWAGIMAFGKEKSPIVQQLKPNMYCAVRMSGMGVALAPEVGWRVAKMML